MAPSKALSEAAVARSFVLTAHHGSVTGDEFGYEILDKALIEYAATLRTLVGESAWPLGRQSDDLKQRVIEAGMSMGIMTAHSEDVPSKDVRSDDSDTDRYGLIPA